MNVASWRPLACRAPLTRLGLIAFAVLSAAIAQSPAELRDQPARATSCPQTGAAVAIDGVGRATYDRIEFDGLTQQAVLTGSVCVELDGQDARVLTGRLDIRELDATERGERPTLEASGAIVDTAEWRLRSGQLRGRSDDLTLEDVVVLGDRMVGRINRLQLTPDARPAEGIVLRTEHYEIAAQRGRLSNDRFELNAALVSPCRCDPPAIALSSDRIDATFDGAQALALAPSLLLFGAAFELAEAVDLRDGDIDFEAPIGISRDDDLGTTLGVDVVSDASRNLELGVTSEPNVQAFYRLDVRQDGTVVRFQQDALTTSFSVTGRANLTQDRRLDNRFLLRFGDERDIRIESTLKAPLVRAEQPVTRRSQGESGRTGVTGDLEVGAGLAAEPTPQGGGPFGPRIPLSVAFRPFYEPGPHQRFEVTVRPSGVLYPSTVTGRADAAAGLSVVPQWTYQRESQTLRLFFERRAVAGNSPFDFDQPEPRRRAGAQVGFGAEGWSVSGRAVRRLEPETPGFEDLDAGVVVRTQLGTSSLEARAAFNLAGYYGGPSDERQRTFRAQLTGDDGRTWRAAWTRSLGDSDPARELQLAVAYPHGASDAETSWGAAITWDEARNLDVIQPEWTTNEPGQPWSASLARGRLDFTSDGKLEGYGLTVGFGRASGAPSARLGFEQRTQAAANPGLGLLAEWPLSGAIGRERRLKVTPFVDVNATALSRGDGISALNAHGLDVSLDGCCGDWYANYRYDPNDTGLTASLGLRLPPLTFTGPPLDPLPELPRRYGERP
jgi:hypothetical protein